MNALVILLSIIMLASSLAMFLWTRRRMSEFNQQVHQLIEENPFQDRISAVNTGSIGIGNRLLILEKELHNLSEKLDELESRSEKHSPYAQAIQLARKGSSAEEIMELCDISYNEAQLILMMHRQRDEAA